MEIDKERNLKQMLRQLLFIEFLIAYIGRCDVSKEPRANHLNKVMPHCEKLHSH